MCVFVFLMFLNTNFPVLFHIPQDIFHHSVLTCSLLIWIWSGGGISSVDIHAKYNDISSNTGAATSFKTLYSWLPLSLPMTVENCCLQSISLQKYIKSIYKIYFLLKCITYKFLFTNNKKTDTVKNIVMSQSWVFDLEF